MRSDHSKKSGMFPNCYHSFWAVLSGVLLALSYPTFDLNILAWFALVPLLYALFSSPSLYHSYLLGLLTGMSGIVVGFYWIAHWASNALEIPLPFNLLFLLGFAFCFGQVFGIITLLSAWIKRYSNISEIFIFPIVLVSVFSVFPLLFRFSLADGQWQFLTAIQPIDITGIWGLDFVMAISNSLIFYLCFSPVESKNKYLLVVSMSIICFWFITGWFKLNIWDEKVFHGQIKKIGIVQPNRTAVLSKPKPLPGYSREYPLEMQLSETLKEQDVDLLIWPEGHFFGYSFWSDVRKSFRQTIAKWKTPLVFYDATRRNTEKGEKAYNTIHFLNEKGELKARYDKIKLVPFSEYLPLLDKWALFDWILGDYLDNLTPGNEAKIVPLAGMKLVPKVCYEPLFPEFVAETIGDKGAGKVLVVQSQDGWFGETSQPFQHMAVTVMRAVENRVPLVHVIQNGPSGIIHPNGRFAFLSKPFIKGSWVAEMSFSPNNGGSFFSGFPNLFLNIIRLFCLLLLVESFIRRRVR